MGEIELPRPHDMECWCREGVEWALNALRMTGMFQGDHCPPSIGRERRERKINSWEGVRVPVCR